MCRQDWVWPSRSWGIVPTIFLLCRVQLFIHKLCSLSKLFYCIFFFLLKFAEDCRKMAPLCLSHSEAAPPPRGETSNGRRKCFPKLLHFSYITLLVWRTCWRQSVEMKCTGFFSIYWLCAPLTNIYAPSMANENRNAYCVATTWWLSFLFCYDVKQLYFKDKPSNYV